MPVRVIYSLHGTARGVSILFLPGHDPVPQFPSVNCPLGAVWANGSSYKKHRLQGSLPHNEKRTGKPFFGSFLTLGILDYKISWH